MAKSRQKKEYPPFWHKWDQGEPRWAENTGKPKRKGRAEHSEVLNIMAKKIRSCLRRAKLPETYAELNRLHIRRLTPEELLKREQEAQKRQREWREALAAAFPNEKLPKAKSRKVQIPKIEFAHDFVYDPSRITAAAKPGLDALKWLARTRSAFSRINPIPDEVLVNSINLGRSYADLFACVSAGENLRMKSHPQHDAAKTAWDQLRKEGAKDKPADIIQRMKELGAPVEKRARGKGPFMSRTLSVAVGRWRTQWLKEKAAQK